MSARTSHGRNAITDYRVLKQFEGLGSVPTAAEERSRRSVSLREPMALIELTLHTGRTHQIRVHMAHVGHPIVGDAVYGRKSEISIARPMLHAYKLGFTHPRTGKFMEFVAPVPDDMVKLCES
jgi:23S rRNA pseudouridine1911/1915/1917 synthase